VGVRRAGFGWHCLHLDRDHCLDVGSFAMNREDLIQEMIRSKERYQQSVADLRRFEFRMAVAMIVFGSFLLGGSISFLLYRVMQ